MDNNRPRQRNIQRNNFGLKRRNTPSSSPENNLNQENDSNQESDSNQENDLN
ncbi:15144_t:CDS:2 [Cetraspora pellucida]|uniref:15144_t:CDS:1 n=1 Tax=Cetraspora pellucida TaxID=1433469 RepID=A0ACA9K963_9GLOM|nr:15144_t:CDS:2 [Cetraspora pellucida]